MVSNCPVCESKAMKKYHLKYDVYICKKCGLEFAPNVEFNMNFQSDLNEGTRLIALKDLRVINYTTIIETMKKYLHENARGLEVGSSYGLLLEIAKSNGFFPIDVLQNAGKMDFIIYNYVLEANPLIPPYHRFENGASIHRSCPDPFRIVCKLLRHCRGLQRVEVH